METADKDILEKRAILLAAIEKKDDSEEAGNLLLFKLGTEKYAIPYDDLHRIIVANNITKLPNTTKEIKGIIYHQGELLTVINLKYFLGIPDKKSISHHLIVINNEDKLLALAVDIVIGPISYNKNKKITNITSNNKNKDKFFKAIYQSDITIIDTKILFKNIKSLAEPTS